MLPVPSPLNVCVPWMLKLVMKGSVPPITVRFARNPGGGVYDVGVMIAGETMQTVVPENTKVPLSCSVRESAIADDTANNMASAEAVLYVLMMSSPLGCGSDDQGTWV